jgi:hypothetical protein
MLLPTTLRPCAEVADAALVVADGGGSVGTRALASAAELIASHEQNLPSSDSLMTVQGERHHVRTKPHVVQRGQQGEQQYQCNMSAGGTPRERGDGNVVAEAVDHHASDHVPDKDGPLSLAACGSSVLAVVRPAECARHILR